MRKRESESCHSWGAVVDFFFVLMLLAGLGMASLNVERGPRPSHTVTIGTPAVERISQQPASPDLTQSITKAPITKAIDKIEVGERVLGDRGG